MNKTHRNVFDFTSFKPNTDTAEPQKSELEILADALKKLSDQELKTLKKAFKLGLV